MVRFALLFALLAALTGCFKKTTEDDKELNTFAEARQRAATYYDGGDYTRAAAQYSRALEIRPDHVPTRLGYAYSLMFTDLPSNQLRADQELVNMGKLDDERMEVKRVYCLGMVHRNLAKNYQRRSRLEEQKGDLNSSRNSSLTAREHARRSLDYFGNVIEIDDELATRYSAGRRVSASLKPDAYVAMAHCEIIMGDATHLEHYETAEKYILEFASIARTARKFWMERRERILAEDPLTAGDLGDPGTATPSEEERKRYERRILSTISQEVAVRRALMDTYLYLNNYARAIQEANVILSLDSDVDEVVLIRGRAYASLEPPDYESALKDLNAYRARQDLSVLTENLVRLNRLIRTYEQRLDAQRKGLTPPR